MRNLTLFKAVVALALMLTASGSSAWTIRQEGAYLLGEEEYVYGFPLVIWT